MLRPSGHPWVAATLDFAMAPLGRLRPGVLANAKGQVLEVGVGTGMNFAHYPPIQSWSGIEPDPHMRARAKARLHELPCPGDLQDAGAEALPFEDESFDTVIATWVFCTIPDGESAAAEIARVLRPGGQLAFIEHVGAVHSPMRTLQGWIEPVWKHCAGGCHLTRDPVTLFEAAGLTIKDVEAVGATRWNLVPHLRGHAVRCGGGI